MIIQLQVQVQRGSNKCMLIIFPIRNLCCLSPVVYIIGNKQICIHPYMEDPVYQGLSIQWWCGLNLHAFLTCTNIQC